MIGSGTPTSQSNAPFPKDMAASVDVSVQDKQRWLSLGSIGRRKSLSIPRAA
jgi:hypothetical protein